jgi:hypothetical protein
MTYFHTCRACVLDGACKIQSDLKAILAGLGIRSIKHRCTSRVDRFKPGDPILVKTIPTYERDEYGEYQVPKHWFQGHFVRYARDGRPLVFVTAGTVAEDDEDWKFEPNGSGFIKAALTNVKARKGEPADIEACRWCAGIPGLGQPCGRDPNYTPARSCLVACRAAPPTQEAKGHD